MKTQLIPRGAEARKLVCLLASVLACLTAFGSVGAAEHHQGPYHQLGITVQRNAATGYAVTQYRVLQAVFDACAHLSDPVATDARQTWATWRQRNWMYVGAARAWLTHVRLVVTRSDGEAAGEAFSAQVTRQIDANVAQALTRVAPGGQIMPDVCARWRGLAESPAFALQQSEQFGASLAELAARVDPLSFSGGH